MSTSINPGLSSDGLEPLDQADEGAVNSDGERRASHLGFVAHEIRNPLSTALWTAELLGRMAPEERAGARGEKLAGMCLRSLQRVRHLVEDHLLSERLDTGAFPVNLEVVSAVDAVVAAEGRRHAAAVPLVLAVPPDLSLLADRLLIGRILDALLDAAGQGGGEVTVEGRAAEGEVVIVVRGAPAEPRSMEDPLKGASSDTRGRALAIPAARRAAERMGGRLTIRGGGWALALPEAAPERLDEG